MKPYYSLSDFPDRKNAGKNFIARCPKCGTMHLYISKAKGLYHCFYTGCDFNGILTDYCKDNRPMFPYKKGDSPSNTGTYRPQDSRNAENSVNEVPMLPGDYKALAPTVLQKIKPLDESPDCTDSDQLAARRYLADQGISSPPPLRHTSAVCAITASPKTVRTSENRLPASFPASPT